MASTERKYSLFVFDFVAGKHGCMANQGILVETYHLLRYHYSNLHSPNDLLFENFTTYVHTYGNDRIKKKGMGKEFLFSSFFIKSCILERARKGGEKTFKSCFIPLQI